MSDKEMELKINVAPLRDYLTCPVCMGRLRQTYVTNCGHRYCESCIRECVDRMHRCPCCNGPLTQDQLIKDSQFDALIESISKEEGEAEKQYFNHLINAAASNAVKTSEPDQVRTLFSPVENVLKEHLKQSLITHETFSMELQKDLQKQKAAVEENLKHAIERIERQESCPNSEELQQSIEHLKEEAANRKAELDAEMSRCAQLVAEAYDRYLTQHIPNLDILPVTVTLSLINKGISIADVRLKPLDRICDIKKIVADEMLKQGDRLMSFGDDVRFLCFSPFVMERSLVEMSRVARDVVERHVTADDVIILPDDSCPVMQFSIRPGSEIVVYGTITFESDLPKKCFLKTFNRGDDVPMDFFTCSTCKTNWLCRPCTDVCHKGHDVTIYVEKHIPKCACCYCYKKKKCLLQN